MSTDLVAVALAALDLVFNAKILGTSEPADHNNTSIHQYSAS